MIISLCFLALIIGAVHWRASAREAAAEASHPPLGEIIDVGGIPVHVFVQGRGPDLVLIHGASGNLRDFTFDLTNRLTDRYRVIAFDRPGLGYTGRLPGSSAMWSTTGETPQAQAALLQAAADQIGVRNPIVLGHSYGGAVALAWSLSRPEDTAAAVLIGAVAEPWEGGLGLLYDVASSALGGALVVPLATAFLPTGYLDRSIETIFAPQPAPNGYGAYIGAGLTLRRASTRANAQQVNGLLPHVIEMQKQYDTLTMPIELVHGDADTIVPADVHAKIFASDVPSARLTLLPDVGHMPQHIDPQSTIDAIDRAARRAGLR